MWPQQNYLTSVFCLNFLTNKMGIILYVSGINMCKLLFGIVGYVFCKVDSISNSSLPMGSLEGEKDFSLKNPK